MVIGTAKILLRLHAVKSLKGKRKIVKSIINRIKNKFNASVAEVGSNDVHDRAEIGLSLTGTDHSLINSIIDKIFNQVEEMGIAEIIDTEFEIMTL